MQEELIRKFHKLERRHSINRWMQVIGGTILLLLSVSSINSDISFLKDSIPMHIFFAAVGGAMLGAIHKDWNGNKELKFAREAVSFIQNNLSNLNYHENT